MTNKLDETDIKQSESFSVSPLPEEMIGINEFRGMNLFIFLIIAMAMIPWIFGDNQIFGFNITGWSWVIPTVLAGMVCMANIRRITFPIRLWLPWIGLLCLYWFFGQDNPDALQSFLQMLSPITVGCAASTFRPGNLQLETVIRWITRLAWIVWIILLIRVPTILTGILPGYGFMAAEMIGVLLLGACYASFYACGSGRHLLYYLAMVAITIISLTRGPIVSMISCLPLTLAPLKLQKRVIMCLVLIICGIILFSTERIQQRMFYTGSGEISDLRLDNPNFQTNARVAMWNILWTGVEKEPWFGNGWNSHRTALLSSRIPTYAPHNDWLKLLHDMGIVGASLYLITMLLQMFSLVRIARWSSGAHQMLAYGAASAFIPYSLIMFTDNIILYVQFFGNLHFALIGIVYGTLLQDEYYQ